MAAILLALGCAGMYGAADFFAGLASRRASYVWVALVVQATAAVILAVAAPFAGGQLSVAAALWGAFSGIGCGAGSVALYRGFARGQMAVAGPISAVGAAVIPVLAGLVLGERPSALTLAGVLLVFPAVWLIARAGPEPGERRRGAAAGAGDGVLAGAGFGMLFLGLGQAPDDSGLWATAATLVASLLVVAAMSAMSLRNARQGPRDVAATHQRPVAAATHRLPVGAGRIQALLAGIACAVAPVLYAFAARRGLLIVVAVLAALYPGVTVLLARLLLREMSSRSQLAGLALAAAGVVAITAG
ncbi:MAG: EamA family transporter [Mycobacteriales bacterium]